MYFHFSVVAASRPCFWPCRFTDNN
jgi:hypothetical protein